MEWRTVPNHTMFQVTACGLVRRVAITRDFTRYGKTSKCFLKEKILSPFLTGNGYYQVSHLHNSVRKKYFVHRLVGFTFVDGYEEGLTINHINGVKTDNRAENLEWISLADNTKHQWETGLVNIRGEAHPSAKLSNKQVAILRKLMRDGISPNILSELVGVSAGLMYKIRDGIKRPLC